MLPIWPTNAVAETTAIGIAESTVTIPLPQLGGGPFGLYPTFSIQYRRHGTTEWIEGGELPNRSGSVELEIVFPDGLYEIQVQGISPGGDHITEVSPPLLFYTLGRGKCKHCTNSFLIAALQLKTPWVLYAQCTLTDMR